MRATSARAKKVRQAVRTWRILMAIGLGALIVFLLACLATMGFLHYQASNRGKKLEQAELNKNVIVADSFTWAVGCLSAPADNHCSDEDVTKAGNDLNSLAPHVTLDVEGDVGGQGVQVVARLGDVLIGAVIVCGRAEAPDGPGERVSHDDVLVELCLLELLSPVGRLVVEESHGGQACQEKDYECT